MSSTRQTRRGAPVGRLLGLLAVLLGVLAMHGLASGYHAAAAAPVHSAAPALAPGEQPPTPGAAQARLHPPGRPAVAARATGPTAGLPGTVLAGAVAPACDDHCPGGLGVMCAAVLAAAAAATALAAAAARRPAPQVRTHSDRRARAPALPQRLLPRPDPVSELCVSRT